MPRRTRISLVVLFCVFAFFAHTAQASAATLYFYSDYTSDDSWNTVANWWADSGHSSPAGRLPGSSDDVVIVNGSDSVSTGPSSPVTVNSLLDQEEWIDAGSGITVTNGATLGEHDGTYQANLSGGTITGTTTITGNSYIGAGGTATIAIFNENSVNYGTAGSATFNDTTANNGTVTGTATFNGSSYSNWDGSVGTGVFNSGTDNGGAATTATFNGSAYNDSGDTLTTATFNGSSYNQYGTIGTATFNNSSYNADTVNTATFNDTSENSGSVGTGTFNDSSVNAGNVTVTAIFNGDLSTYQSGTVEFAERRYTSNISISRNFTSDPFYWTVLADGAAVNIHNATYDGNTTFTTANGGSFSTANTIYANASSGSDSSGNGTSGSPYKTFNKAYTSASAGDILDLTGTFSWSTESGNASTTGYTLAKNITINGHGPANTIIEAGTATTSASSRVFTVSSGVTASISGVDIRYGKPASGNLGGGIKNSGTLTINNCNIDNNYVGSDEGGGLDNTYKLTVTNSAIFNNYGYAQGGGIYDELTETAGAWLTVTNDTIYGNRSPDSIGTTFGAGIGLRGGSATITNDTITGNIAATGGGLGMETTGAVILENNIIAGNSAGSSPDFWTGGGTITDNGYNIIGATGTSFTGTGDWTDSSGTGTFTLHTVGTTGKPLLDAGPSLNDSSTGTFTYALLSGSIAINNGTTTANGATSTPPTTDQRGATRSGATDIGAYEYNGGGLTITTPSVQATNVTFSNVNYNRMTVAWTAGNGSRRAVFMKAAASGTASPVNDTAYTANSIFGSGSQIGSSGWYEIYDGSGTSVAVTGLTQATNYTVQVFEYGGVNSGAEQYDTATATGDPATQESHVDTTYYANAATGSDSTGDGSSGNPYKTFNKAYSATIDGDTVDLTGTFSWSTESGNASTTGYTIGKSITIAGHGPANTIIEAGTATTSASSRVFTVSSGATVTITGVDIRYGITSGASTEGAGILNNGTLTVTNSNIDNNYNASSEGGGIANDYLLTVTNSTIFNNYGYQQGGGLYNDYNILSGGYMTVTNDTFYGNRTPSSSGLAFGAAIGVRGGSATLTNNTLTGNIAYYGGGLGMDTTGIVTVENNLIVSNTGHTQTSSYGPDYYNGGGTLTDNGYNIIGVGSSAVSATGDWTDQSNTGTFTLHTVGTTGQPKLDSAAALNNNSNGTYTYALLTGSIAINNGTTTANGATSTPPTTDQRGATRSGATDIGAYEYNGGGLTTYYSLTYAAGANGTITGSASQNVASGGSGTAVTAVANSGYHFTSWSDASTTNPRTDTNVTQSISLTASFASNDTTPPIVAVTAPTSSALVSGTSVALTASSTDDQAVAGVTFYIDGTRIGSEITSGAGTIYTTSWNSTATSSGTHTIVAVSRDTSNNYATSSPAISFTVDNTVPTASVTAPSAGATVFGTTSLTANASDNVAVASVTFYVNGGRIGSPVVAAPYTVSWDTTATTSSAKSVVAVAVDTAGNIATSSPISFTVDNTPPVISAVSSGTPGSTSATITWTTDELASSTVNYGASTSYGTASTSAALVTSHSITLTGLLSATTYQYQVASADSSGNVATSSNGSFTTAAIPDTTPPTASTTAPTIGAVVSGTSVTLSGYATDNVAVAGVTFYVNGVRIGGEITSGAGGTYSTTWDSTATSSGNHSLVTVARDTSNNYATSTPVSFTVSNVAPTALTAAPGAHGATLAWSTVAAASSRIYFGPTTAYGSSTPEINTSPRVTTHAITLGGLVSCAAYHYEVTGTDAVGNSATSSDATFITSGCTGGASVSASNTAYLTTGAGGTLTQGAVTLTVPASFTATSTGASFEANQLDASTFFATAGAPSGMQAAGATVFNIKALTDATTTLSSFSQPLTITLSYTPSDVSGLDLSSLGIYRYDGSLWTALTGCTTNTTVRTVTCSTNNFSDFSIFGTPTTSTSPPTTTPAAAGAILPGYSTPNPLPGEIALNTVPTSSASPAPASTAPRSQYLFTRWLEAGMTGTDVAQLQMFLNAEGFLVATASDGSPGHETTYFGSKTKAALMRFQQANAATILASQHLSAPTGYFGPATLKLVNSLQ